MKFSIHIEDATLPELHAMLGVFLEAIRSPRQGKEKDKVISHPGERSGQEAPIKARCDDCNGIEADGKLFCYGFQECPKQSCAYCGKQLGDYRFSRNYQFFCNMNCADLYDSPIGQYIKNHESLITGPLMANDLPGKENIPSICQSAIHHSKEWILGYITRCLRDQLPYPKIIAELRFHGVEMSPAELAGYLEEIAE